MSSSRRDGPIVIVTTGGDVGRTFLVVDECKLGFDERGRPPTPTEKNEPARYAPLWVPSALKRERRKRRFG